MSYVGVSASRSTRFPLHGCGCGCGGGTGGCGCSGMGIDDAGSQYASGAILAVGALAAVWMLSSSKLAMNRRRRRRR